MLLVEYKGYCMSAGIWAKNERVLKIPNAIFDVIYHEYMEIFEQHPQYEDLLDNAINSFRMASSGTYLNIDTALPNYEVALAFFNIAKKAQENIENIPTIPESSRPVYRKFYEIIRDRAKELAIIEDKQFVF